MDPFPDVEGWFTPRTRSSMEMDRRRAEGGMGEGDPKFTNADIWTGEVRTCNPVVEMSVTAGAFVVTDMPTEVVSAA
jgi:hypothetical protein